MFASSTDQDFLRLRNVMRFLFVVATILVIGYFVTLTVRPIGSYSTGLDGWGVDLFDLTMGLLCLLRYRDPRWRSANSIMRTLPLIIGAACIIWSIGDVAHTLEAMGGVSVDVPSVADFFYLVFFPVCYFGLMTPIRRGNWATLLATSLDGIIAATAATAIAAAYLYHPVLNAIGGSRESTIVLMAYPGGDFLLLSLTLGALLVLPKTYRPLYAV